MYQILKNANISSGYDLLCVLKPMYNVGDCASWWWPSYLSIEVKNGIEIKGAKNKAPDVSFCIASILGQNTKYENAAFALYNLYEYLYQKLESKIIKKDLSNFINYKYPNLAYISNPKYATNILEIISEMDVSTLINLIKKAGFHNQKSQRLIILARNILQEFGTFECFYKNVTKEWLLKQKGIGQESASSILNYCLGRNEMVVDKYTQKLLCNIGFNFSKYYDIQNFLCKELEKAKFLYDFDISLAQIMARFHGKIVEFSKKNKLQNF